MNNNDLTKILETHSAWIKGIDGGKCRAEFARVLAIYHRDGTKAAKEEAEDFGK